MSQIWLRNITLSHGTHPLIKDGQLAIERGEKVCIIGRNGAGKSTLLKCLMGQIEPEMGSVEYDSSSKFTMLQQTIPTDMQGTVTELVSEKLTEDYEEWEQQYRVDTVLTQLDLPGDVLFNTLSGGLKRRVLLACALVTDPDVLLLDEPTNHLDIEAILWLETFLKKFRKTLIFITHDRELMQQVATHIVEIDHGKLISWRGEYQRYLTFKDELLHAEAKADAEFDKRLAQEEVWIRQGVKARRTRNEGRVRALKKMRDQRSERLTRKGNVNLSSHDIKTSGKIVFEAKKLSFQYNDQPIISNFSTIIQRGDKVGLIGANGSGKSTLINLLLGRLQPTSGELKQGTKFEVAYFDQTQTELDDEMSVQDNVGGGSDTVTIGDQQKHIMGYLQDFLFTPQQARGQLKYLSGGERNRVMLARLLLKPCNVLVLDEPTNDLDIETLELLETALVEFKGTILLVSHDREFLNNVVTSTFAMEKAGHVGEYVGGYDDWLRQKPKDETTTAAKTTEKKPATSAKVVTEKKKLSYNEKRELEKLPARIEELEQRQKDLQQLITSPDFYKQLAETANQYYKELTQIEQDLEAAYARWQELE